jgi:protein regulator of cytokinesis 1
MKFLCLFHPGLIDPYGLLANIESQILKAKEESLSRKDMMDRINKWIAACDEEAWLEEYNQVLEASLEWN